MSPIQQFFRRFTTWFNSAKSTERISAIVLGLTALGCIIYFPVSTLNNYLDNVALEATQRRNDLEQINKLLGQYKTLNTRLDLLKASFDESLMTFEEVTSTIDQIVKQSIGSDSYSLQKLGDPSELGFDYEKQDFQIIIRQANLEQVVKLLYNIEQGERPLFLGNINLTKVLQKDEFVATLKIFSVRKS